MTKNAKYISFTGLELAIIDRLLVLDDQGNNRQFGIEQLGMALDIRKEIMLHAKDDKLFDGNVTLSTEEKTYLLQLMASRTFSIHDGPSARSLYEKLK